MQLQAVIVPPVDVVPDVLSAAQNIRLAQAESLEEERRGGLLQRFGRRGTIHAPPDVPFTVVPADEGFVRLTRFGNVTGSDTETLGIALGIAALDWPAPVVHVESLSLDLTGHSPVITAHLGGDTDGLRFIFRSILEVAKNQRFFLDRRIFNPEFPVASVDIVEDAAVRERLQLETETFRSPDWQVAHISLMSHSFTSGGLEEIAIVPLGGAILG